MCRCPDLTLGETPVELAGEDACVTQLSDTSIRTRGAAERLDTAILERLNTLMSYENQEKRVRHSHKSSRPSWRRGC